MIKGYGEAELPKAIAAEEGKKAIDTVKKQKQDKEASKAMKKLFDKDDKSSKESDSVDEEDKTDYQLDRAIDILHAISIAKER